MRSLSRATSHALAGAFFLVGQPVAADARTVVTDRSVDFIFTIDVSGSMDPELARLKRELGNMLPRVLRGGDTFSLIYFSGPGQCAVLIDQMAVRTGGERLRDVTAIQQSLAGLETIGMTCFTDPLLLLANFATKMKSDRPGALRAGFFGSDGYDNMSPGFSAAARRAAIMDAVTKATGPLNRWTTLGVGWGCDQSMLQEMAARGGGEFLFSRDVDLYARNFESAAGRRPDGARRKVVSIEGMPVADLVFSVGPDGALTQYAVEAGEVSVAENAGTLWYVSPERVGPGEDIGKLAVGGGPGEAAAVTAAYAAIVLFAQRCKRKVVRALAFGLRDARFMSIAGACFGPQRYQGFADIALEAVKGSGRFIDGACSPERVDIETHAYTVLEALAALRGGNNRIVPDFEGWTYTPITRARIASAGVLTEADVARLAELAAKLTAGADVAVLGEVVQEIVTIKASKGIALTYDYLPAPEGYRVDGVAVGSEEANVSVRIKRPIRVDLGPALGDLSDEVRAKLPGHVETFRYAQYTIITGRVLNAPTLPVRLDESTWETFRRAGLVMGPHRTETVIIDFSRLPMINDAMMDELAAADVVRIAVKLELMKAALKPINELKRGLPRAPGALAAWVQANVSTAAEASEVEAWLEKLGIEEGGYSPKSASAPRKADKRRSWKLDITLPGLSKLPSPAEVRAKLAKIAAWQKDGQKGKEPKLTRGETLVAPGVEEVDRFLAGAGIDLAKLDAAGRDTIAAYVKQRSTTLEVQRADLLYKLGQAAITVICGGEWFSDLKPGETEVEVELAAGEMIKCGINVVDVEIPL